MGSAVFELLQSLAEGFRESTVANSLMERHVDRGEESGRQADGESNLARVFGDGYVPDHEASLQ
jgi:hypothetical protein